MMLLARSLRSRLRPPLASAAAPFSSVSAAAAEAERAVRDGPRNDWTRPEIQAIYDSPLLDLLFHGVRTHASLSFRLLSLFRAGNDGSFRVVSGSQL
jgi:biotin synthase